MDLIEAPGANRFGLSDHGAAAIYRYDAVDREFLQGRVAEFREQVARRLSGALTEEEFKPLRLMNGLYLQLHAYMLRVAIPYGVLSARQLRQLARVARTYDRGWGHFTTRQNIQFNWITLQDAPDVLAMLAEADIHAIQTSGNCIRNVTTDEFAGAAADEAIDPRIYAEILRQWSTLHPEFSFLPRKFKISITGAARDRAAIQLHDIGLVARHSPDGAVGFEVWVGGGLGRVPILGTRIRDFLPEADFLGYMEAILRVYNALGGRENIHKARIKILLRDVGAARFTELVEAEFAAAPRDALRLDPAIIADIAAHFAPQDFAAAPQVPPRGNAAFRAWARSNTHPHRAPGYISAVISLKPIGGVPGDMTADQMDALAGLADEFSFGELRVSHIQNLVLPHVRQDRLEELWRALGPLGLATANIGLVTDIIACPGLDYCALANARSINIAQDISARFADADRQRDIGPVSVNISGCINACGHHHVGAIGILGVDKKGVEFYQVTLGGAADNDAAIGTLVGPALPAHQVVDAVETILDTYLKLRDHNENFVDCVRRLGTAPFRDAIYAPA